MTDPKPRIVEWENYVVKMKWSKGQFEVIYRDGQKFTEKCDG
jgi:hypothetical protein